MLLSFVVSVTLLSIFAIRAKASSDYSLECKCYNAIDCVLPDTVGTLCTIENPSGTCAYQQCTKKND